MGGIVDSVFGGGQKAPKAPDPYVVAAAQAQADKAIARTQASLNRFNQATPWGNLTWQDLGGDKWTSTVNLSPDQQAILDATERNTLQQTGLAGDLFGNLGSTLRQTIQAPTTAMPNSGEETRNRVEDALYSRMTSRLDPRYEQAQGDLESKLMNSGFMRGTEAWEREMGNLGRERDDAYQQAANNAITMGGLEDSRLNQMQWGDRANQLSEQYGTRDQLLQELLQLNGSQVQNPQFMGQNTSVQLPGSSLSDNVYQSHNANLANYNAQVNSNNSLLSGLMGLGGAYMLGGGLGTGAAGAGATAGLMSLFSDSRLKTSIIPLHVDPSGVRWYEFEYIWAPIKHIGVMAQEVLKPFPEVVDTSGNFLRVDYKKLQEICNGR